MIARAELDVSHLDLERDDIVVDRDEQGNIVSITRLVEPSPLIVTDAEYLSDLGEVQSIMQAMQSGEKDDVAEVKTYPYSQILNQETNLK